MFGGADRCSTELTDRCRVRRPPGGKKVGQWSKSRCDRLRSRGDLRKIDAWCGELVAEARDVGA